MTATRLCWRFFSNGWHSIYGWGDHTMWVWEQGDRTIYRLVLLYQLYPMCRNIEYLSWLRVGRFDPSEQIVNQHDDPVPPMQERSGIIRQHVDSNQADIIARSIECSTTRWTMDENGSLFKYGVTTNCKPSPSLLALFIFSAIFSELRQKICQSTNHPKYSGKEKMLQTTNQ